MTEYSLKVAKLPDEKTAPYMAYDTAAVVINADGWLYTRGVVGFDFWADADICAWRMDPRASGAAINSLLDEAAGLGVWRLLVDSEANKWGSIISEIGGLIDVKINLDKSGWVIVPGDNRPLVSGVKAIHNDDNKPRFGLGRPVMTCGINEAIKEAPAFLGEVIDSLSRHVVGDWGNMPADDKKLNDEALKSGNDRIFSGYNTSKGKIWIITEWDRSYTTVMFSSEY